MPLQPSLRFLCIPLPAVSSAFLAVSLARSFGRHFGLTTFRMFNNGQFRLTLFAGSIACPRQVTPNPVPAPSPFWLKPAAVPSACRFHDVYRVFTYVSLAAKSWPYSCGTFRKMVSSRIPSPLFSGQALSGKLSQETFTGLPCSHRILPVERQVLSVATSRQLNMRLRVAMVAVWCIFPVFPHFWRNYRASAAPLINAERQ